MRSRFLLACAGLLLVCPAAAEPLSKSKPLEPVKIATVASSIDAVAKTPSANPAEPVKPIEPEAASPSADAKEGKSADDDGDRSAAAEKPRPVVPTLIAKIDLSRQRMEVIVNGTSKYFWPVSSGAQGYETPRGTFQAQWSAKLWHSRKYDLAPMPHAVFFHGGAAIHATTSVSLLGQPASHGCVRLAPANAAAFYALVQKHSLKATQIQVFGKEPAPRIARREPPRPPTYNGQTVTYLPPGSPYAGRPSFVHNGVLYVRVR